MGQCVICDEANGIDTPLAYQDAAVSVFPARWQPPGHPGYALLVTRLHIPTLYDLADDQIGPLFSRLRDTARAVELASKASGTTIRQNNNPPSQEIDHLHFHIVPRFIGDGYWNAQPREIDATTRQDQANALSSALDGPTIGGSFSG